MTSLACRSCAAPLTRSFVDLGRTPLANSYVPPHAAAMPDPTFPLHARVCDACLLVQVEAVTPPETIFGEYAYFSSYSSSWVAHARRFAEMAARRFGLTSASQVVEVASNDGYLLRHFVADLIAEGNTRLTVECLAVALGLSSYNGESMTSIANRHGVSRAAVSKRCVDITTQLNLPPSRAMRSEKARKTYQKSRTKHHGKKKHQHPFRPRNRQP